MPVDFSPICLAIVLWGVSLVFVYRWLHRRESLQQNRPAEQAGPNVVTIAHTLIAAIVLAVPAFLIAWLIEWLLGRA
jgi:heme/copper-type cytochrome/quinol oxidase subunit 2